MKYIALLSGGKDSCYNLLHCQKNGHELVASASLGPEAGKEELDSYMYQTVGQDAIELVARALDVPLYRRVISGEAIEQGSEYGARTANSGVSGDETEDLYALLSTVKSYHPDVQGVSVGAILSNYQRVRVEHVCRRLNLTPLCYLWQRDQGQLMSEMIAAGMKSILIKVAGIGLTVSHLGHTLAQMEPTLIKLHNLYGAHICGEGGEYETLTLDCPLFKQKIVLHEVETVIHSDNDFATVAFLRVKKAALQDKEAPSGADFDVPELLDEDTAVIEVDIPHVVDASATIDANNHKHIVRHAGTQSREINGWVSVGNVVATTEEEISVEQEVRECFQILRDELARHSLELLDCTNINIFLSSMDIFATMNAIYGSFFGTSPPARACVAICLPRPHKVMLECIAHSRSAERHALHVQSLSYWAPANIGPYSQAILTDERVFVSGQIGLIPSSLTLPSPQSLPLEAALAGQHANRVVRALSTNTGSWTGQTQLALYWLTSPSHLFAVREPLASIDVSPTLFVVVQSLPKGAVVEKQILLHTGRVPIIDEDGETVIETRESDFTQGAEGPFAFETSTIADVSAGCTLIFGRDAVSDEDISRLRARGAIAHTWTGALSVRIFYVPSEKTNVQTIYQSLFEAFRPPVSFVPCAVVSSRDSEWDYALCIIMV
ncbi:Diphthami-syn-2 domain-containing protein [Mycena indigotica]|uniref:Diphthine--ammonia ligase n=1 Tax=Mycena indigotica TaxID=2126181 RepID=A0A8H6W1Q8_9AGAR|nr:Diphthami-syn-2 domain-containing protein [Mycena indigotica]KAF7301802.1 Diphthami-syn-2 domain-containing protein [Mycena indigotica]